MYYIYGHIVRQGVEPCYLCFVCIHKSAKCCRLIYCISLGNSKCSRVKFMMSGLPKLHGMICGYTYAVICVVNFTRANIYILILVVSSILTHTDTVILVAV